FLTGGKDGNLNLVNTDAMAGYVPSANQVQQVVALGSSANMHCQAAYYKGSAKEFIYVWSENQPLRAIPFDRGSNLMDPQGQVLFGGGGPTGQSGAVLSVSSNGSTDGTGILWASYASSGDAESFVSPGILRAFDANDVTREVWNNQQNAPGDVDDWTDATINYPLPNGDHLWTESDARAEITVGSSAFRLAPQSAFGFLALDDRTVQVRLSQGSLNVRVRDLGESESLEIDTPSAAGALLRSGVYRADAPSSGDTPS